MSDTQEILPALAEPDPAPVASQAADEGLSANLAAQAREHPGLVVAGGLALGLVAGALLPRGTARKLARGAIAAAAVGGEAGVALAQRARSAARSTADEAADQWQVLEAGTGEKARRLRSKAASAAGSATSAGLDLARAAMRLLASLRR